MTKVRQGLLLLLLLSLFLPRTCTPTLVLLHNGTLWWHTGAPWPVTDRHDAVLVQPVFINVATRRSIVLNACKRVAAETLVACNGGRSHISQKLLIWKHNVCFRKAHSKSCSPYFVLSIQLIYWFIILVVGQTYTLLRNNLLSLLWPNSYHSWGTPQ